MSRSERLTESPPDQKPTCVECPLPAQKVIQRQASIPLSFRNGSKDQISDVQLQIRESLDSGFDAGPVIGRALRGAGGIAPE